jgi:hypothetical protein
MILAIAKLLTSVFGLDLQKAQRFVIYGLMVLVGVFVLVFALWMRSCMTKPAKLDQQEIIKAQQAIAVEDRKQMVEILASSDAREAVIDGNLSNAKADTINAIYDSKVKWNQASDDEVKAELLRRLNQ